MSFWNFSAASSFVASTDSDLRRYRMSFGDRSSGMPVDSICARHTSSHKLSHVMHNANHAYHAKKIDEHVGVLPKDVVCLAALITEDLKILGFPSAHHVGKVGSEHERGLFTLDTQLLLVVPQEVTEVNVYMKS